MDRALADRRYYRGEASLAARLSDRDRTDQMRDLYELFLAFQRGKSPDQIVRELRAEWNLNRGRLNPRYLALLEEANRVEEGGHGGPDAR